MVDTYFRASRGSNAVRAELPDSGAPSGPAVPDESLSSAPPRARRASGGRARIEYLAYPPTSLPHRDLLVLEQIPIGPNDRVCEVGVGSGATAARVARLGPREVVGLDVSADAIEAVRELERRHSNLELRVVDVTVPEQVLPLASRFDLVFSCDTLEHVADPDGYFAAIAALLSPGGRCFMTFPNEPPEIMHGITRFDSASELEARVRRAGLRDVHLGAARLTPRAASLADLLGWRPLAAVRGAVKVVQKVRGENGGATTAQRFEETNFYRHHRMWRRLSPAVNLYWYAVLQAMGGWRPAFEIDWGFRRTPFEDCQVVVRACKPSARSARGDGA